VQLEKEEACRWVEEASRERKEIMIFIFFKIV
jgi:hypothetical protein